MTKITPTDRKNLIDMLEVTQARGEEAPERLDALAELCRLLENGEAPLRSDAAILKDVVRGFVDAWGNESGRPDYTALRDRLAMIAEGARGPSTRQRLEEQEL